MFKYRPKYWWIDLRKYSLHGQMKDYKEVQMDGYIDNYNIN